MAYDKKNWMKAKEEEKKQWANEAIEKISFHEKSTEEAIEFFKFMARMYDYSPRNIAMMKDQYPGALFVGSKEKFKELGFNILEDQKPINILAPNPVTYIKLPDNKMKQYKYATKEEKQKVQDNELKTVKKMFYKLAPVYDVTQTDAKPKDYPIIYPNARMELEMKDPEFAERLKNANIKYLESLGIPVNEENFSVNGLGVAKGYYSPSKNVIGLNKINTPSESVQTLMHETAHAIMHKYDRETPTNIKELEAELTSFVVNKHYGIDTSDFTIPYVATWTDNMSNVKDVEKSLKNIAQASEKIINGIDKELNNDLILENKNELRVSLHGYNYDDYKKLMEVHGDKIKEIVKSDDIYIRKGSDNELPGQNETYFSDSSYLIIKNENNFSQSDLRDLQTELITSIDMANLHNKGKMYYSHAVNLVEIKDNHLKVSNVITEVGDFNLNEVKGEEKEYYLECIELFEKTNAISVVDNKDLDHDDKSMSFEEFKEFQSHLPIKSNNISLENQVTTTFENTNEVIIGIARVGENRVKEFVENRKDHLSNIFGENTEVTYKGYDGKLIDSLNEEHDINPHISIIPNNKVTITDELLNEVIRDINDMYGEELRSESGQYPLITGYHLEINNDEILIHDAYGKITEMDLKNVSQIEKDFVVEKMNIFKSTKEPHHLHNVYSSDREPSPIKEMLEFKDFEENYHAREPEEIQKKDFVVTQLKEKDELGDIVRVGIVDEKTQERLNTLVKKLGIDREGEFKQPVIKVIDEERVMPLKTLTQNIQKGRVPKSFDYEVFLKPDKPLFKGSFNKDLGTSLTKTLTKEAENQGLGDTFKNNLSKLKNIEKEKSKDNGIERSLSN